MAKEIILEFKNYKLFKARKFNLTDHMVYIFQGKNGIGKSSAITGLEELIGCMAYTTQPVTQGEKEGWKKVTWTGLDGKLYTIEHTFDTKSNKGKFVAYDEHANQITSVTKIRELLGTYSRITVDQFFELAKTVPGRRKIVEEYFNRLLTMEERSEIQTCKAYEEKAYEQRTQIGRDIKAIEPLLKQLTEEEEKVVSRIPEAKEKVVLRRKQLQDVRDIDHKRIELSDDRADINSNFEEICSITEMEFGKNATLTIREEWTKISKLFSDKLNELGKDLPSVEELEKMITTAEGIIERGAALHARKSEYSLNSERYDALRANLEEVEEEISTRRNRILDIYNESELPTGIEIDGDNFKFHGYDFSKEQISESEAKLAIAEMMCQIDTAGLIVLGNASIFGEERMEQICEMAKKYNKKVFLERVVEEDEVSLIGIVDANDIEEPSKKEPKPKSNEKKKSPEPEPKTEFPKESDDEPL